MLNAKVDIADISLQPFAVRRALTAFNRMMEGQNSSRYEELTIIFDKMRKASILRSSNRDPIPATKSTLHPVEIPQTILFKKKQCANQCYS